MKPFPHEYLVTVVTSPQRDVDLSAGHVPTLQSASPAEFGGPGDRWSPETFCSSRPLATASRSHFKRSPVRPVCPGDSYAVRWPERSIGTTASRSSPGFTSERTSLYRTGPVKTSQIACLRKRSSAQAQLHQPRRRCGAILAAEHSPTLREWEAKRGALCFGATVPTLISRAAGLPW